MRFLSAHMRAMVFNWTHFCSPTQQHLSVCGDMFRCLGGVCGGGATGVWWVEARDAAKHPAVHRRVATTKNLLAQSVRGGQAEKPCSGASS